ncbi:MAG: hypothetical protein PHD01_04140 [Geobacteraceae bacterium]|nr:hypothetical protein [Geobacteraceae bacterium]
MRLCYILILLLVQAAVSLAHEVPKEILPEYNCDYAPSCEVGPGVYGKINEPVTSKFNLSIGGFVKLDYAYNSVNFGQSGSVAPASGSIPKSDSTTGKQSQSIFTARQSRFWLKVGGPTFLGAKTNALIEVDFYGDPSAASESPQLRMRQAWGALNWKRTSLLFGQTWDIFGPMGANTIDFRQGASFGAPMGTRVPQIRITHKLDLNSSNSLNLILGVQDPTQTGNNSGTATAYSNNVGSMVNVAGQVMWKSDVLGVSPGYYGFSMNSFTAGLFGLYGSQKVTIPVLGDKSVDSWGTGIYTFVPILRSKDGKNRAMTMSFEGQVYMASNMAFNAATALNFVGLNNNPHAAKGYGLAGQIIFYPTQDIGVSAGYLRRNAYNYSDYRANIEGTTDNFQKYNQDMFVNVAYDLNAAIRVAAEYEILNTHYGNSVAKGTTTMNGSAGSGSATIARLAVFYFF